MKLIGDRPRFFFFFDLFCFVCLVAEIIQTGVHKECVQNYKQSPTTLIASNYCWCKWGKVEGSPGCYYIANDSLITRKECGAYRTLCGWHFLKCRKDLWKPQRQRWADASNGARHNRLICVFIFWGGVDFLKELQLPAIRRIQVYQLRVKKLDYLCLKKKKK